jgi:hypothetical protein
MGEVGYAISERDYGRMESVIRRVERMADINFRRRLPVGGWSPGGGGGYPKPTERVGITDATPSLLVKELHEKRWLWCVNYTGYAGGTPLTADKNLIMPADPSVGDIYYFLCIVASYQPHEGVSPFAVHIYPNAGQTIIMPAGYVANAGVVTPDGLTTNLRYVDLDDGGLSDIMCMLILVCKAANTWICWDATHSSCKP